MVSCRAVSRSEWWDSVGPRRVPAAPVLVSLVPQSPTGSARRKHKSGSQANGDPQREYRPEAVACDERASRRHPDPNEGHQSRSQCNEIATAHDGERKGHDEHCAGGPHGASGGDTDRGPGVGQVPCLGGPENEASQEEQSREKPDDPECQHETLDQMSDSFTHSQHTRNDAPSVLSIIAPWHVGRNPDFSRPHRCVAVQPRSAGGLATIRRMHTTFGSMVGT